MFIALAFILIPIYQYVVQHKTPDSPYRPVIIMLAVLFSSTSISHLVEIWTVWRGEYDILGYSKAVTAFLSMSVAIILLASLRKLPALKTSDELQELNRVLQKKIDAQNVATEKLSATEKRLRTFLKQAPDAMTIVRANGKIEYSNDMMNTLFGYPPGGLDGKSVLVFVPARSQHKLSEKHNDLYGTNGKLWSTSRGEFTAVRKDGTEFPAEIRVNVVSLEHDGELTLSTYRDLTEQKASEADKHKVLMDMAHVSRMSSVDQMAASLAHELNQPLTAISNNLFTAMSMYQRQENPDPLLLEMAEENYQSAQRAGEIIKSLRRLVRKSDGTQRQTDINDLVKNTTELINPEARIAGIDLDLILTPDLPEANIDPVQIQQVIVNLGRNAIEAHSTIEQNRRVIIISTERYAETMIVVKVYDNGPGVTEKIKADLFIPNVTSKEGGMGLGLSICLSIIEAQGGQLWHDDDQDQGATFCFTLPCIQSSET
jgi:two-component system sensor kinase FixL